MPKFSSEGKIGLGMEILVIIFERLNVTAGYIIWPLFGLGALLIADSIFRGEWRDKFTDKNALRKRVIIYTFSSAICLGAIAGWLVYRIKALDKSEIAQTIQPVPVGPIISTQTAPPENAKQEPSKFNKALPSGKKKSESQSGTQQQKNSGGISTQQESVGPNSPNVSAPNGIAIGGGMVTNPTVNNFGPPPAVFSFSEEVITSSADGEKLMKVHITTDRSIPGALIGIIFSGPVEYSAGHNVPEDDPTLKNAPFFQLSWGGPLKNNNVPVPNSMSVFVNTPAMFLPGQEIIVPVKSKNDVHVLQVMQIGAEKP